MTINKINFTKRLIMKNTFVLTCYYLGLWGIFGFFVTLIFGFLACCLNLDPVIFYGVLVFFAAFGIVSTFVCVSRKCKCLQ